MIAPSSSGCASAVCSDQPPPKHQPITARFGAATRGSFARKSIAAVDRRVRLRLVDGLHRGHRLVGRLRDGAAVEIDGERGPAGLREAIGPVLDVFVQAPPLVDHDDRGERALARRAGSGTPSCPSDRSPGRAAGAASSAGGVCSALNCFLGERPGLGGLVRAAAPAPASSSAWATSSCMRRGRTWRRARIACPRRITSPQRLIGRARHECSRESAATTTTPP